MKNTAARVKDNPKLKQRAISDGKIALYLEYYLGRTAIQKTDESGKPLFYPSGKMAGKPIYEVKHNRRKEELKLYLFGKPRTAEERTHNTNVLTQARTIRNTREQELLSGAMGYNILQRGDNLIPYFENYVATYTKKDVRTILLALNRFKDYLRLFYPSYTIRKTDNEIAQIDKEWADRHKEVYGKHPINQNDYYRFNLNSRQFTESMVKGFVSYLQENSTGSGAATLFARFKKIVKNVLNERSMPNNPCANVICKKNDCFTKDILSDEEIKALQETHIKGENPNIRRAFLFTLYTGVRWCDVKDLKYSNIDYQNKILRFEQSKTKGHSAKSVVTMPIVDSVLKYLIGRPEERGKVVEDRIFDLPSHTMCLKALRHWCSKAGIEKHITWHCGRHSFATNLLEKGANVKVVADLLGHSGLAYVERYVRAIDESKRRALNSLPELSIDPEQ